MHGKSVIGSIAGIAAFIAASIGVRALLSETELFASQGVTTEELAQELATASETFTVMRDEFPDDFSRVVDAISAAQSENPDAVRAAAAEASAAVRRKHASLLKGADDQALITLMDLVSASHRVVSTELGSAACADFAAQGPGALGRDLDRPAIFAAIDDQATSLLRAIASGKGKEPRSEPSPEDWQAVLADAQGSEERAAKLNLVLNETYGDPAYCEAIIWFFAYLADSDVESASGIRAHLAVSLASG